MNPPTDDDGSDDAASRDGASGQVESEVDGTESVTAPLRRHPVLMYTLSRVGVFLAALAVFYATGARGLVLLALAFFVSGAVSLVLLNRQRDAMSAAVSGSWGRLNDRIEESKRAEDVD